MALDVTLSITIDSDREGGNLSDGTTYGTGGNPARADLRVFATGYKVAVDLSEDALTLVSNTGDPETVSSYTFNIPADGYFKFLFVAVPEYAGGTPYALYDAATDTSTNIVYRSLQAGNLGHAVSEVLWWEVISDPSSLASNYGEANESANIASLVYERVLTPNSEYTYANLIGENCACTDCDENELIPDYNIASLWLNGMIVADQRVETIKGETLARRFSSKFIDN
jgi:hypothetical protein